MSKLDTLMRDALLQEDKTLLQSAADQEPHHFSPAYLVQLHALAASPPRRPMKFVAKRIAAIALAAVLLISSVTAAAFWGDLSVLLARFFPQYATFLVQSETEPEHLFYDLPDDWGAVWVPMYIPEGYHFSAAYVRQYAKQMIFTDGTGANITLSQIADDGLTYSDVETGPVVDMYVSGYHAYGLHKTFDGTLFNILKWTDGSTVFYIRAALDFQTLVTIGESLKLTETGDL